MNKRRIAFTAGFAAIIVGVFVLCMIIGRGHTVYFDNKTTEDELYKSYNAIDIYYKGEKVTTLGPRERISITLTGQSCTVDLVAKKGKLDLIGEEITFSFKIPYDYDGYVINLPAYLEGAEESYYACEFVPVATVLEDDTSSEDEVPTTDEFGMASEEE